ncbi:YtcA family lipoprotein [Roseomonas fluvialis]|uniref:YtcA family lipoprotein n=1 Tax=Roseomonas fluvialis TaxID=1750527 RepID=UPI001FCA5646|nr:YtcA family lipoprotein [Roseomonas fluvialis]
MNGILAADTSERRCINIRASGDAFDASNDRYTIGAPELASRPVLYESVARYVARCTMSPSLPLFGAYFPFWLVCVGVGVVGAVALRVAFIRFGIDEVLPLRLLVYVCCAATIGLVIALTVYGR